MMSLGFALARLGKGFVRGFRDPEFRALLVVLGLTIAGGSIFYRSVESWSWVDSFYFAVMTLATLSPEGFRLTSDFSKLFTAVYVLGGLGVMISFSVTIGGHIANVRWRDAPPPD